MRTDTSRSLSLSLSLCLSLSRSRSFSRSRGSLSLIADSLSCCRSLCCSFSVLLSRTLSRSRSRFLSHAVSPKGGKGGDTATKISMGTLIDKPSNAVKRLLSLRSFARISSFRRASCTRDGSSIHVRQCCSLITIFCGILDHSAGDVYGSRRTIVGTFSRDGK